ncbi:hypothetical protein [Segatella salivae]|uniref:hypothetical protein n=1 Tax=Segatella salivae TaxID=228604 RepID=UPI0012DC2BB9|nr:hypothetical protein [Segatella salivae]
MDSSSYGIQRHKEKCWASCHWLMVFHAHGKLIEKSVRMALESYQFVSLFHLNDRVFSCEL